MSQNRKVLGEERRELLLSTLKKSGKPITGAELARRTNVSRQVIVADITLLKAREEPIIATSQGYVYMEIQRLNDYERTIACYHTPDQAEKELMIIVDHGAIIKDVTVEHPVYGDLTASIMVSSRQEVKSFLAKMKKTNAALLSDLTDGIHLHTISSPRMEHIEAAIKALKEAGILINENT